MERAARGLPVYLLAVALSSMVAAGCGAASTITEPSSKVMVVTTTSILADFARQVGGDRVSVRSLVPPGADIHTFQSTPADSVAIGRAVLIISNGAGLDDFLQPVVEGGKSGAAVHLEVSHGLDSSAPAEVVSILSGMNERTDSYGSVDQGVVDRLGHGRDPHFWQNPMYAIKYVERIRDYLVRADPEGEHIYRARAAAYTQTLRLLDSEIATVLGRVPPGRRQLLTFHDAFGHFAERYGWDTTALVPNDASDVTPAAVAEVVERVRDQDIPALFSEPQLRSEILEQAAGDLGVAVGLIYSDALDTEVPTYVDMMRFNAESLVRHLGQEQQ